ncbi:hypothetical protein [Psychrobacter celer]|uniref:hypothetical protein n=1 Tax=Psychrobacter celer TaxID=306572 RepID=UPI003FD5BB11
MFNVDISSEKMIVKGEFVVDSYFFDSSKYDYAFYLYKYEEKIDSKWYTDSMKVEFSIEDTQGDFYIKAFLRDKEDGSKRIFNSEKISIHF